MTLDSIPAEILSLILDAFTSRHLKDIAMPEDGDAENIYTVWCDNRHTLKALRLVCHRIHDFASPLLFHNLSISATSDSIALANNITLRPHLVAGIRGVRLYTGLYRERIAQNRRVHEACVLSELESFLVQRATDIRRGHGRAFINKTLFQNYYRICAALRGRNIAEREMQDFIMELEGHVDTASLSTLREMMAEQGDTVNKEMQEYRGIMSQGHRDYRSNLGKQRRLLNTGEFMVALARCLARIPQLVTLEMNRSPTRPKHPRDALENKEDLRELITSRHQGFSKTPDLYRDTIFSGFMVQLPIDLYRAGVRLKTLKIDMLTTASPDDHLVTDESYRLPNHLELMANFAASVQTLESVTISVVTEMHPYWQTFADDYMRAVLSGQTLQRLEISVPQPETVTGRAAMETTAYRIGRIVAAQAQGGLRHLHLAGLAVWGESLCRILKGGEDYRDRRTVWLDGVYLQDGLWSDVVDNFRRTLCGDPTALKRKPQPGRPSQLNVKLNRIMGGEMGSIPVWDLVGPDQEAEYRSMGYEGREPIILLMAEDYIRGDERVEGNPFKVHKDNQALFRCRRRAVRHG